MNKDLSNKLKTISFILVVFVVITHADNTAIKFGSETILVKKGINWFIQNTLSNGVAKIASPLFFSISGFLFYLSIKNGTFNEFYPKYRKRFKTLVLPYLLWSIYGMLLYLTLQSIPFSKPFFTNELIANYSITQVLDTIILDPIPYHFWFVSDLVMLVLISPILYWLINNFNFYIILIFLLIWTYNVDFQIFTSRSLLFFSCGSFFSIKKINMSNLKYNKPYLIFSIWLILIIIKTTLIFINFKNELLIELIHKSSIIFGIISIWLLYDHLFKNKDISKTKFYPVFQYSFFLFAFHEPTLTIIKKAFNYFFVQSELNSFLEYISATTITIFISILIGYYMKIFIPKFYYLLTGGR